MELAKKPSLPLKHDTRLVYKGSFFSSYSCKLCLEDIAVYPPKDSTSNKVDDMASSSNVSDVVRDRQTIERATIAASLFDALFETKS